MYFVSTAVLAAAPSLTEALDDTNLAWTTGGAAVWFGQTTVTHDGVDAAQSGVIGNDSESWVQTTVTGPGNLIFWWKVSCEAGYDGLEFLIDEAIPAQITGEIAWKQEVFQIAEGVHTLKWKYIKDVSDSGGQDCGWVDAVSYSQPTPSKPTIIAQPTSQTVGASVDTSFSVTAIGFPTPQYQWRFNGSPLANATNSTLLLLSVTTNDAGSYTVAVTNSLGGETSTVARLTVILLAEALDGAGLTWSSGGARPWHAEVEVAHDGADAAESGTIGSSQESWVETSVIGPGTLSFWWKVSSESNIFGFGGDVLEFVADGVVRSNILGEVAWQRFSFSLPAGSHSLRWRYTKDASVDAGQDAGWVDQVQYAFAPPQPPHLQNGRLAAGGFALDLDGEPGRKVLLQASTDLSHWTTIYGCVLSNTPLGFIDALSTGYPRRFYRLVAAEGVAFMENPKWSNGQFAMNLVGEFGRTAVVQVSSNLRDWAPVLTNRFAESPLTFSDPASGTMPRRFYRLVLP